MLRILAISALFFIRLVTIQSQATYSLISSTTSNVDLTQHIDYACVFTNRWTSARHPIAYPRDAHWSPMVLAAHSEDYTLWNDGLLASPGVQRVAETGSTGTLIPEVNIAGAATNEPVRGPTLFTTDRELAVPLPDAAVDQDHPYVSAITMIAPSSDWFSGFSKLDARDPSTNTWLQEFEVETYPWDAGSATDSFGPQTPQEPIFEYTVDMQPSTESFLNADGTAVLSMANWKCTMVATPNPSPSVAPSPAPSMQGGKEPTRAPETCSSSGQACLLHADCCGAAFCFQTCTVRKVPSVDSTSKLLFIIGPSASRGRGSRLRGG